MSRRAKESGSIYVLRNRVNGKCYVGQTIKVVATRVAEHKSHPKMLISKALRKYGRAEFDIFVVQGFPVSWLDKMEIAMIARLKTIVPMGYNCHLGGQATHGVSDSTREKLSIANKGNNSCWGRVLSETTKAKLRAANLGRRLTPEQKAKLSRAKLGIKFTEEHKRKIGAAHKGRVFSSERRHRMSLVRKGKRAGAESPRARPVRCIDTGINYDTVTQAEQAVGVATGCISGACSGRYKTSGGYHWQYREKESA